jgi:hypothetical protein
MISTPTLAAKPKNIAWHNQSAGDVLTQLGSLVDDLSAQRQHNALRLMARIWRNN